MTKKFISRQKGLPLESVNSPFSPRPFAPAVQAKVQDNTTAAPSVEHFPQNSNLLSRLTDSAPEAVGIEGRNNPHKIQPSVLPITAPATPPFLIQAKLTVGALGNPQQQKANRVARQNGGTVQRSPLPTQQTLQPSANVTQSTSRGDSSPVNIEPFKNDALVVKEFVTAEHKQAISTYCKKNNVILSVRDTGSLSLDRIKEGAKPKPHTILEKSIKESSLAKAHPEAAKALADGVELEVPLTIEGVSLNDLKGFVGHWDTVTGKLLGLRVDKRDTKPKTYAEVVKLSGTENSEHTHKILLLQSYLEGKDTDSPYIPLKKFKAFQEAFGTKWKQYLYTGDYDLHEVYKHNKTLLEGSREKARLLTGINQQIAKDQGNNGLPLRKGKIEVHEKTVKIGKGSSARKVPASTLHTDSESDYAMIQHGDQMGYITNQLHEGRLKQETRDDKGQLVGAVAEESPGPLAWCVRGEWYVTKNKDEHQALRRGVSVTASSGWLKKSQDRIKEGKNRVLEIKTNQPTPLGKV